jgi:hypothetical protein
MKLARGEENFKERLEAFDIHHRFAKSIEINDIHRREIKCKER